MHVEQHHVTLVNLQDSQSRDFVVFRDSRGCKVSCAARDEVLNILLSYQDFQRLCQTIVQPNGSDGGRDLHAEGCPRDGMPPVAANGSIRVEQRHVTTVAPATDADASSR